MSSSNCLQHARGGHDSKHFIIMEALERAVAEIEALKAIYDTNFTMHSSSELNAANNVIENGDASVKVGEFNLSLVLSDGATILSCTLPPGYPILAATRVSIQGRTRKEQDSLTRQIQQKANELVGQEAVLELVHELQALIDKIETCHDATKQEIETPSKPNVLERRWIWVHHITDSARIKAILQEARELHLGGYLKSGYPGIVVIEGIACDGFVTWIKGNKSRPGGFGRNWGHHVRFQAVIPKRQLPTDFTEFQEMKDLAAACKECGLEEEFLEYVMQHK